jgi:hypothetical protein
LSWSPQFSEGCRIQLGEQLNVVDGAWHGLGCSALSLRLLILTRCVYASGRVYPPRFTTCGHGETLGHLAVRSGPTRADYTHL